MLRCAYWQTLALEGVDRNKGETSAYDPLLPRWGTAKREKRLLGRFSLFIARKAQPLRPVIWMPSTKYLCAEMNRMIMGIVTTVEAAISAV